MRTKNVVSLLTAAFFFLHTPAFAADYEASVSAGLGASDNIRRSAANEIDEQMLSAGFSFRMTEATRRLNFSLFSQFDFLHYVDDTFDSDWVGGLNGRARVTLVDERLRWVFQNNFGQALFDPLQPSRPNNRENVNVFSTGPSLSLLPASRNTLDLDLRYFRTDYEFRPNDNDRISAALRLGREIRRSQTVSLNANAARSKFDNGGLTPDIERREIFAGYDVEGSKTTLGFDLGYSEVEFEDRKGDGIVARARLSRELSANGVLTASAGSQYSDQGDIFRFYREITTNLRDTADITDSPAPFRNDYFTLSYGLEQTLYTVDALIGWSGDDYETGQGEDRDIFRANLDVRRELSRNVYVGAGLGFQRRDFNLRDRRDNDLLLSLIGGYRFSPLFDVSFEYSHFQRDSSQANGDFTENRVFIRATYVPAWGRKAE